MIQHASKFQFTVDSVDKTNFLHIVKRILIHSCTQW